MEFQHENLAKSGAPMPEGLSAADQFYYQQLAFLSARYRHGDITAEDSVREKRLMEREWRSGKSTERYISNCVDLWFKAERAACTFAKERTVENALKMYEAIYGDVLKRQETADE